MRSETWSGSDEPPRFCQLSILQDLFLQQELGYIKHSERNDDESDAVEQLGKKRLAGPYFPRNAPDRHSYHRERQQLPHKCRYDVKRLRAEFKYPKFSRRGFLFVVIVVVHCCCSLLVVQPRRHYQARTRAHASSVAPTSRLPLDQIPRRRPRPR